MKVMKTPNLVLRLSVVALLAAVCVVQAMGQQNPTNSGSKMLNSLNFTMPQSVIDAEIDGTVVIAVHIDKNGTPTKVVWASGPMWPCGTKPLRNLRSFQNRSPMQQCCFDSHRQYRRRSVLPSSSKIQNSSQNRLRSIRQRVNRRLG